MKKCAKPKVKRRKRKSHTTPAAGISGGQPAQRRERRSEASATGRSVSAASTARSANGKRRPVPKTRGRASQPRRPAPYHVNRAVRPAAVAYPREDWNALALLLMPFLIMAAALGAVQQWRAAPTTGDIAAIASKPPPRHPTPPKADPEIAAISTTTFSLPPIELDTPRSLPRPGAIESGWAMPPIPGDLQYPKSAPEFETASLDIRLPALRMPLVPPEIEARIVPPAAPEATVCTVPPAKLASLSAGDGVRRGRLGPRVAANDPGAVGLALAQAARTQTKGFAVYTARYRRIAYPLGDVASLYGVCTDVVIRAYRAVGIDLQVLVQKARVGSGDPSIDHRRTATLGRFFARQGASLPITAFPEDYKPGDIVTYHRPYGRISNAHIAVVSDVLAPSGRPMVVHNRGYGPQLEDALFADRITGHYRYSGPKTQPIASAPALVRTRPDIVKASFLPLSAVGQQSGDDDGVGLTRPGRDHP
ncbi:MAG: DUF1287 domain-containing protein [Hyphomicrobiaceae bacterium]